MPSDKSDGLSDEERQELLALYQVTTQDLAFFKSQQWTLTNYGLVGIAAIVGSSLLEAIDTTPWVRLILSLASFAVVLVAGFVLWNLHRSIEERRGRLERTFAKLSDTFREARGEKPQVSALSILLFLWFILALGFTISIWVIWASDKVA